MKRYVKAVKTKRHTYNKGKESSKRDKRCNAIWLWVGVLVGKRRTCCSYSDGTKKITFCILQKSTEAIRNKPRRRKSKRL